MFPVAIFTHSLLGAVDDLVASYLVFMEASVAAALITAALYHRPRASTLYWLIGAAITLTASFMLALIGASIYFRAPVYYYGPMGPDMANSFPSHHALLAGAIVAVVFLVRPVWSLPFALVTLGIDVALVAGRHHHLVDVVGSTVFVAAGTLLAVLIAPVMVRWLQTAPSILPLPVNGTEVSDAEDGRLEEELRSLRRAVAERDARQEMRDRAILEELRAMREGLGTHDVETGRRV